MGHYSSFILRLWVESDGQWRSGLIQHVATRTKRRFSTLEEMLDFISQYASKEEFSLPFTLDGSEQHPIEESDTVRSEPLRNDLEETGC